MCAHTNICKHTEDKESSEAAAINSAYKNSTLHKGHSLDLVFKRWVENFFWGGEMHMIWVWKSNMSHEICMVMKLENRGQILKDLECHAEEVRLTLEVFGSYQKPLISLGIECLDLFQRVHHDHSRENRWSRRKSETGSSAWE